MLGTFLYVKLGGVSLVKNFEIYNVVVSYSIIKKKNVVEQKLFTLTCGILITGLSGYNYTPINPWGEGGGGGVYTRCMLFHMHFSTIYRYADCDETLVLVRTPGIVLTKRKRRHERVSSVLYQKSPNIIYEIVISFVFYFATKSIHIFFIFE